MTAQGYLYFHDDEVTYPIKLTLPGEPITIGEHENGCSICGEVLTDAFITGESVLRDFTMHRGFITIQASLDGGLDEIVHLRCGVDSVTQGYWGTITIGDPDDPRTVTQGRHAAVGSATAG